MLYFNYFVFNKKKIFNLIMLNKVNQNLKKKCQMK